MHRLRTRNTWRRECDNASAEENIKVTDSGIMEETNEEAKLTIERPDDDGLPLPSNDADNPSHGKSKMT